LILRHRPRFVYCSYRHSNRQKIALLKSLNEFASTLKSSFRWLTIGASVVATERDRFFMSSILVPISRKLIAESDAASDLRTQHFRRGLQIAIDGFGRYAEFRNRRQS
jgi:hypothetical protein